MGIRQRVHVIRGYVAECGLAASRPDPDAPPRYRVEVKASGRGVYVFFIETFATSLAAGHAVSIWIWRNRPAEVLGYVDHTAVDGANLLRCNVRLRPDHWDAIIISAATAGSTAAIGGHGLVALPPLLLLYWLLSYKVPGVLRSYTIKELDTLITQESQNGSLGGLDG